MGLQYSLYQWLCDKFPNSMEVYAKYKEQNAEFHENNKRESWKYLKRLLMSAQSVSELKRVPLPEGCDGPANILYNWVESESAEREDIDQLIERMKDFDIISFDIFDTLIFRKVEEYRDVFIALAVEMNCPSFVDMRLSAYQRAREKSYEQFGSKEATLEDIYDQLQQYNNIDKKWMDREIELELELCTVNPYFFEVYKRVLELGKPVIIVSDMYLPKSVIEKMLHKCGYTKYDKLFLSNEYKLSKTDGTLWDYIVNQYAEGKTIFHSGDNANSDIKKAKIFGIETNHYESVRDKAKPFRESNINNLAGSFYRGVINNNLLSGMWQQDKYFEHGYKVSGILTYGYCQWLERRAEQVGADLILFCARDCDIVSKVYTKFFNKVDSKYIKMSRYAMLSATSEQNLWDLIGRVFAKNLKAKDRLTIRELFEIAGLEYLLDDADINTFNPEARIDVESKNAVEQFILSNVDKVLQHNERYVEGAKKYFENIVKGHTNILIVDIGWTGSCINMLSYFLKKHFSDAFNCYGALMFCSDNRTVLCARSGGRTDAYLVAPDANRDIYVKQRGGSDVNNDLNNQVLEYMFTSKEDSLLRFVWNGQEVEYEYRYRSHANDYQIDAMQNGVMKFCEDYYQYTLPYKTLFKVDSYVACAPYFKTLNKRDYIRDIFGDFVYDANVGTSAFDNLQFKSVYYPQGKQKDKDKPTALLVSHSFSVSGAPRSLLRIGKVLVGLNYNVEVWSPNSGPMVSEYINHGINVRVVKPQYLDTKRGRKEAMSADFAICNTILTNEYYRRLKGLLPTVWYIREATNIPDYCSPDFNSLRYKDLLSCKNMVCVSQYAQQALKQYCKKVKVVKNCVEDDSDKALPYKPSADGTVSFIQLGSLEVRKGFDVLLDAYELLPEQYQKKCVMYFAGQILPTAQEHADEILQRVAKYKNIKYLGVIKDQTKKIEIMSQTDVVVVASRDESCSLVALEGTMLSKPLIVTQNVGAKYMVEEGKNGFVVNTADAQSLADAIKYFIDNKSKLVPMGQLSRTLYEERANMQSYEKGIKELADSLVAQKNKKCSRRRQRIKERESRRKRLVVRLFKRADLAEKQRILEEIRYMFPSLYQRLNKKLVKQRRAYEKRYYTRLKRNERVVISLTSHPPRVGMLHICIESLLQQYFKADKVILWLAKSQFPEGEQALPKQLLKLKRKGLTIEWCDEDLKPHKKYYYAMQKYPDAVVITADDDMKYQPTMSGKLYNSYLQYPHAVSCLRAHMMTFHSNGTLKKYTDWKSESNEIVGKPSYRLLPTGVCGVLYPPHCLPQQAFDKQAIADNALMTDDLWLKVMCVANDYPAVLVEPQGKIQGEIAGASATAISHYNMSVGNDVNMANCLKHCDKVFGKDVVLDKLKD